jgi:hypothetical protein
MPSPGVSPCTDYCRLVFSEEWEEVTKEFVRERGRHEMEVPCTLLFLYVVLIFSFLFLELLMPVVILRVILCLFSYLRSVTLNSRRSDVFPELVLAPALHHRLPHHVPHRRPRETLLRRSDPILRFRTASMP